MSDRQQDRKQTPADAADMRKRAEEQAGAVEPISLSEQTPESIQQMIHELRVDQIEHKMQNEVFRAAQTEIEESQARYFDLYNLAPEGYATVNEKGAILESNPIAAAWLGVSSSALVNQPMTRFILKEDQDSYYVHCKKLFETGEPQSHELRLVRPDGSAFWVYLEATAAEDTNGAPICRVVISDISQRKQTEAALSISKNEFWRLFETMAQGVVYQAADGTIITANPAAEEILGLSLDQMQGKTSMDPHWQMIKEDGSAVPGAEHPAMIALQTGKKIGPLIRGVYNPHKQEYVWISINATPLFKPGEIKPYQVYATFDDLTERKQTEETLQARERFLATILQTTGDGFWVVNNSKRIIQVNDAYCAMSGYSREELLSMTINDLDAVEISEETSARIKQIIENGSMLFETCHRRKDGTIIPLEISVTFLPDNGGQLVCFFRDITERKQAEELLRKNAQENAFQSELLRKAPVIAAFHDRDQNIVWANQAYEEATGVLLQSIVGKKCYSVWNLSEPCQDCPVPKAIATGESSEAELTPQNQKHWPESQGSWLSKASPVRDEKGSIIGAIEVAVNITERMQTEAKIHKLNVELRENEERLSLAIDGAGDGIWDWWIQTGEMRFSKLYMKMLGYEENELPFHVNTWVDSVHPEDYPRVEKHLKDYFEGHVPKHSIELRLRCKDNRYKWILCRGAVVERDNDRNPVRMIGIHTDITKRKELEDELVNKTEELENFFKLNLNLLCIADIDGNFIKVNTAWESLLGYTVDELQKRKFLEFVHPEDMNATLAAMSKLGNQERIFHFTNRYRHQDGTYRHIEWNSQPSGHLIYAAARDVTELLEKEEALRNEVIRASHLQQETERANAVKSEFLSNMSHEIRTPLNAIVGFTDLTLKTSLNPQQSNYLNKIKESSGILLGIVGDILDISKLEADKVELEIRPFEIEEMLRNVTAQFSNICQEKKLELLISMAEDVPVSLMGDSLRLGQILANLTSNAVKFTDEGTVCIAVKLLKNGGSSALLQFSTSDTGIGLTKDQIENLFQPFNQAETSTTRKYGGTGLGLAISKKLIRLMGGEIWVESEKGKGSTFFFTVRFDIAGEKRFSEFKNAFKMWNMKVLVVDDSRENREVIKDILTSMSFDVTTCSSGEEAVKIIQKAADTIQYDLVIMDWQMPEMDGIEASRQIRRLGASDDSPAIIMLTAYNSPQIQAEVKQLGLVTLLFKPVTPSLLLNTIMQIFGKEEFEQTDTRMDEVIEPDYAEQLGGKRVLLVEDNEINQEVAQEILQGAGMTVVVANNGKVATEMVTSGTYDIVLMDVQMPIMNGYDATKAIRNNPAFSKLPIIAMTANALKEEKGKCIQAGMNDYIAKPIDTTLLFRTMEHWLTVTKKSKPDKEPLGEFEQPPAKSKTLTTEDGAIPRLDGIDVQSALSRLGGNQKLYRKLLVKFHNNHQNDINTIRQTLDLGDIETAERMIHTIKGAAGNIGAQEVYTASAAFEAMTEDLTLECMEPLLGQLEKSLEQVFASIALLEDEHEKITHSEHDGVSVAQLIPSLEELARLLSDNDLAAGEFLEDIVSRSEKTSVSDKIAQIKGLVDQYDYDGALEILNEMLRAMNEGVENDREPKQ